MSIEAALELSSLENKLEVSSTYFFVDSDNYNLLEPNNIAKVKDIWKMDINRVILILVTTKFLMIVI